MDMDDFSLTIKSHTTIPAQCVQTSLLAQEPSRELSGGVLATTSATAAHPTTVQVYNYNAAPPLPTSGPARGCSAMTHPERLLWALKCQNRKTQLNVHNQPKNQKKNASRIVQTCCALSRVMHM